MDYLNEIGQFFVMALAAYTGVRFYHWESKGVEMSNNLRKREEADKKYMREENIKNPGTYKIDE